MKIINYLKGGIGNQLFQYAFAKSLAKKFNCELYHDESYFSFDPYGNKTIISEIDNNSKFINHINIKNSKIYKISDNIISSLDQIFKLPADADYLLLDGYWQSEAYHDKSIISLIKDLFNQKFTNFEHDGSLKYKNIAVHIRRKDYEHMGLCRTEYYTGLMSYIAERDSTAKFKIFTDTPNFTRHFLGMEKYNTDYINSGSDLQDLYLMSICDKFIISNSTYSWWAAYLGESENTDIFAPKEWVTLPNVSSPCPERWILIENSVDPFSFNSAINEKFYNIAGELLEKKIKI
jgi:hypothetical protein